MVSVISAVEFNIPKFCCRFKTRFPLAGRSRLQDPDNGGLAECLYTGAEFGISIADAWLVANHSQIGQMEDLLEILAIVIGNMINHNFLVTRLRLFKRRNYGGQDAFCTTNYGVSWSGSETTLKVMVKGS